MACPQKFRAVDQELAGVAQTALKEGKPGVSTELARRVIRKANEAVAAGHLLSGRQFVWILLDYLRTDSGMAKQCNMQNLLAVVWAGDKNIDGFLTAWDRVLANFAKNEYATIDSRDGIEAIVKQELFAAQVKECKIPTVVHDYCKYLNAYSENDDKIFSYDFLRRSVESALDRANTSKQQELERKELDQQAGPKNKLVAAKAGGPGGARGKDKGDGKFSSKPCYWNLD